MNDVEISIGYRWQDDVRHLHSIRQRRPADTTLDLLELRDIVDIVIDGTNLTAPVSEEAIFGLIEQTLTSLVELLENNARKAIIEFHYQPWEMVLVPDGSALRLSLYGVDRHRRVITRDLPIDARSFCDAICEVAERMLTGLFRISEHFSSNRRIRRISQSVATLKRHRRLRFPPCSDAENPDGDNLRVASTSSPSGLTLGYRFDAGDEPLQRYRGEHVLDLHALLFAGRLHVEFDARQLTIADDFPFLAMVSLLERTRQLFNQLESNAEDCFQLHEPLAHLPLGVEGHQRRWTLTMGDTDGDGPRHQCTTDPAQCLDTFVSIGELFVRDLVRANPTLEVNERFLDLRREIEKLRRWHRDLCGNNVYHDRPEDYLRRLGHLQPRTHPAPAAPRAPWPLQQIHTLFPRRQWTLHAEHIDFSSLSITGDSLLVSTTERLRCLSVDDGDDRWEFPLHTGGQGPGSMVVTGERVLTSSGGDELVVVDANDGSIESTIQLQRPWRRLAGAARYHDELSVAAAKNGQIIGFDTRDDQLLWQHGIGPGTLRQIVFDGPITCAQSSEGVITALNPRTGQTLWNVRLGGTPEVPVTIHQGRIYTISHDPLHDSSTLHALYPFTGRTVWQLRLDGFCCGPPSWLDHWVVVPLERHGQIQLTAIDLEAVDPRVGWQLELSSAGMDHPTPVLSATIDGVDHGLVRTDRAELTCFSIADGEVRWRSMPADETLLLHGKLPLFRIGDAVVNVAETVDLRQLDTGRLLQSFSAIEAPQFGALLAPFRLLLGESASRHGDPDRLTAFGIDHFLALVE